MWAVRAMLLEEHDLGVVFGEPYQAYRRTTRRFGPPWLWAAIAAALVLIVLSAPIRRRRSRTGRAMASVSSLCPPTSAYHIGGK